jgi:hypothetical protein
VKKEVAKRGNDSYGSWKVLKMNEVWMMELRQLLFQARLMIINAYGNVSLTAQGGSSVVLTKKNCLDLLAVA